MTDTTIEVRVSEEFKKELDKYLEASSYSTLPELLRDLLRRTVSGRID